jgi:hypothetical protein
MSKITIRIRSHILQLMEQQLLTIPGFSKVLVPQSSIFCERHPLDQRAELDFHSASLLKQQSVDSHIAPLGRIILSPSKPVFVLSP